ncbi:MAG: efflux RND transporter periplasmic adaptor subunit [Pirellulales bacterium]|nr:efflux RND transporter periplasmic adaptor subunit [Pirellulales bacterium]
MNWHRLKPLVAILLVVVLAVSGCNRQQAPPPRPIPEVAVVTVEPERVLLTSELPGRTAGFLVAEIRPQVNGLIEDRLFTEGSQVKAGQVLYQIDPAPYQAALDNATANLLAAQKAADQARAALGASLATVARNESILKLAKTNLSRYENLLKTKATSVMQRDQQATDVDVAEAALEVAKAQVESDREAVGAAEAAIKQAEAAVETARINLGYTKITAPISGRVGRSNVTVGAIVTAYQPIELATIQQFDPIYVDVPQSTKELNRLRRSLANGSLKENGTDQVKILLQDNTEYPLAGSLKFRDVTVDPTTGSVILRIVVPNPEGILLPGMFVRAIIEEGVNEQAILIPQQAVSRDPKGNPTALLVDTEGKVQQRGLTTDRAIGDQWLISSGLAPGERVIVEGLQKARPGATVRVVPFEANRSQVAKPVSMAKAAT